MNYRNRTRVWASLPARRHAIGRAMKMATAIAALSLILASPAEPPLLAQSDETKAAKSDDGRLRLHARTRVETAKGSGRYHAVEKELDWAAKETAVVVCDMWDDHSCRGAAARVAEMAPRANEFLKAARDGGALIIHCPSDCMGFYKDTPQRRRAMAAPVVATARPLERWCSLDKDREAALPIDDSDGGCDCQPRCQPGRPWTRQIATIEIAEKDAITDSAEAYYLMRQRGIKNVIVLGVHTNMCVLGRPFSIRQMVYQGQNVVLVRDLTDALYNSRSKPFVSRFSGTDLVVEHIERHWCPTILSTALVGDSDVPGKKEFRFAEDKRPTVAVLMAEDEYETERTLTEFAAKRLTKDMRTLLIYGSKKERDDVPGIEAIRDADVLLVSVRRRVLPAEQLKVVRDHVAAGKGVVGIRTASHAFAVLGDRKVESGHDVWPEFDRDVLGGNYTGHYGHDEKAKHQTLVRVVPAADHPILRGISSEEFGSQASLYKVSPLSATATPLLMGKAGDHPAEPVAWIRRVGKSRVFYTSLGHKDDFENAEFNRLLENGIDWAAGEGF